MVAGSWKEHSRSLAVEVCACQHHLASLLGRPHSRCTIVLRWRVALRGRPAVLLLWRGAAIGVVVLLSWVAVRHCGGSSFDPTLGDGEGGVRSREAEVELPAREQVYARRSSIFAAWARCRGCEVRILQSAGGETCLYRVGVRLTVWYVEDSGS